MKTSKTTTKANPRQITLDSIESRMAKVKTETKAKVETVTATASPQPQNESKTTLGTQQIPVPTKVCSKCGRLFPLSAYGRNVNSVDGHFHMCPSCLRESRTLLMRKEKTPNKRRATSLALADISDKELIAELRNRNYTGSLTVTTTKTINV